MQHNSQECVLKNLVQSRWEMPAWEGHIMEEDGGQHGPARTPRTLRSLSLIHLKNSIEHGPHVNQRNQWVTWKKSWTRAKGRWGAVWHYSLGYINKLLLTPNRELITDQSNNHNKIQLGESMLRSLVRAGIGLELAQPRQGKEWRRAVCVHFHEVKSREGKGWMWGWEPG